MTDKKVKPEAPEAPEAPLANPDEVKVKFIEPCIFTGRQKAKGDVITVTKAVAKHLISRKLIKG